MNNSNSHQPWYVDPVSLRLAVSAYPSLQAALFPPPPTTITPAQSQDISVYQLLQVSIFLFSTYCMCCIMINCIGGQMGACSFVSLKHCNKLSQDRYPHPCMQPCIYNSVIACSSIIWWRVWLYSTMMLWASTDCVRVSIKTYIYCIVVILSKMFIIIVSISVLQS